MPSSAYPPKSLPVTRVLERSAQSAPLLSPNRFWISSAFQKYQKRLGFVGPTVVVGGKPAGLVAAGQPSTRPSGQLSEPYRFLTIGLSYKVTVILEAELLQSDRDGSYKVTVNNWLNQQGYPQAKFPLDPGSDVSGFARRDRQQPTAYRRAALAQLHAPVVELEL